MTLFRWDEAKASVNKRKHGITFSDAIHVFEDPFAFSEPDRIVEGEIRWQTIGLVADVILVLVAHTVEDESGEELIRIISARRATRGERRRYEQNRYENFT